MAYGDYGAFVYKNSERIKDLEDAYPTYLEEYKNKIYHGIIEDGTVTVLCYKQGLPSIFYNQEQIDYEDGRDIYDYDNFSYELNGYKFYFISGYLYDNPYLVRVYCPNGDEWECEYDYGFGAGITD